MRIGETRRVPGPSRRVEAKYGSAKSARRPLGDSSDTVSIMGIPNEEFTPRVQSAVSQLMEEVDQLQDDISAARLRISNLESVADEDPLVALVLNRRGFEREFGRALTYFKRYGTEASLVFFDLDQFKNINDTHGHAAGDAALRHVGSLLLDNVRKSDLVGRMGGDEFVVVLQHAGPELAGRKAEQLVNLIKERPLMFDGREIPLSAAAGVTEFRGGDSPERVLARADDAMYLQKVPAVVESDAG